MGIMRQCSDMLISAHAQSAEARCEPEISPDLIMRREDMQTLIVLLE